MRGKGKTFFHVKKSFSLPPRPHPFSKKARYGCSSLSQRNLARRRMITLLSLMTYPYWEHSVSKKAKYGCFSLSRQNILLFSEREGFPSPQSHPPPDFFTSSGISIAVNFFSPLKNTSLCGILLLCMIIEQITHGEFFHESGI